jgi:hypothetical protein
MGGSDFLAHHLGDSFSPSAFVRSVPGVDPRSDFIVSSVAAAAIGAIPNLSDFNSSSCGNGGHLPLILITLYFGCDLQCRTTAAAATFARGRSEITPASHESHRGGQPHWPCRFCYCHIAPLLYLPRRNSLVLSLQNAPATATAAARICAAGGFV